MKKITLIFLCVNLFACTNHEAAVKKAESVITNEVLAKQISVLASNEFMGRKPMTVGEGKSIDYIRNEFKKMALTPAFGESYYQKVPMVEINYHPSDLKINTGKKNYTLTLNKDFVAFSKRVTNKIELDRSQLVFAGFGIVAPEYHWNDYAGVDVKGKTVIVLVNDPGFVTKDSTLFTGNAMTYYGRWTYKYEEAARQGAAGVLIVHEDKAASYPWSVVETGANTAHLYIDRKDNYMDRCKLEGWLTKDAATALLSDLGMNYEELKAEACKQGFKPVLLPAEVSLTMQNTFKKSTSNNVGAMIQGTTHPGEAIVYVAHWDHLGVGKPVNGDSIYNGANDNASGVASLLEIAKAFSSMKEQPQRSLIFLAVTAEEAGLLGSEYYVEHPVIPMAKTIADITMDGMGFYGYTNDIQIVGYGLSDMDNYVKEVAREQNRVVLPESHPEDGSFYRSDQLFFAFAGVPVLYLKSGDIIPGMDKEKAATMIQENFLTNYHKPSDEFHPGKDDLAGDLANTKLLFRVGAKLADGNEYPDWNPDSPYQRSKEKD